MLKCVSWVSLCLPLLWFSRVTLLLCLWSIDPAGAMAMTGLPWRSPGARLQLPRDLHTAYLYGRLGAATPYDVWQPLYGSLTAARWGALRLERLGILRTFPRTDLTRPFWYGLTERGHGWVVAQANCPPEELRLVAGLKRANLPAWAQRNRLWSSLIVSCKNHTGARLSLVRPEWELRRLWTAAIPVVPDMMVMLDVGAGREARDISWAVELDSGCERITTVWRTKAQNYCSLSGGRLYGMEKWHVLALVPSARRAAKIAHEVCQVGAGSLIHFAVGKDLEAGHALDPVLWRASDLLGENSAAPARSLAAPGESANSGQHPRAVAARTLAATNGGIP